MVLQQERLLSRSAMTFSSRREEVEGTLCEVITLRSGRTAAVITEEPINFNSGLMTDAIDSAIDDQNAVLTGILIQLE